MDRYKNKSYLSVLFRQYKYYVYAIAMIFLAVYVLPVILRSDLGLFGVYAGRSATIRGTSFNTGTLVVLRDMLFFITPFIFFRHLYSKTEMDTYFSIPVPRGRLFANHFLFNYAVVVIPMLLSFLIGFLAVVIGGNVTDMSELLVGFLLKSVSLAFSGVIILALSVLAITLTTTMFNGLIYAGVFNIIPLVVQLLYRTFESGYYGYTRPGPNVWENELLGNMNHFLVNHEDIRDITSTEKTLAMFVWFGIALVLVALALHLYRNRKVYRIEGEFMVKGFYSTIISVFTIMVLVQVFFMEYELYMVNGIIAAMSERQNATLLMFLAFLVAYYIVQMVRLHGRPNFVKTIATYILLFVVALGITQLLYTELIYKTSVYVPELAEVEKVVITNDRDFSYDYGEDERRKNRDFDPETERYFVNNDGVSRIFEEHEIEDTVAIAELITWQKEMIDRFFLIDYANDGFFYDFNDSWEEDVYRPQAYIKVTYLDSNDNVVSSREYRVYAGEFGEKLSEIVGERIYYEDGRSY